MSTIEERLDAFEEAWQNGGPAPCLADHADPEDVVQSAFRSFFRGCREGRYLLQHSGEMWHPLVAIAQHKLKHQIRRHSAEKRSVARETRLSEGPDEAARRDQPSPSDALVVAEEIDRVMDMLRPVERRMFKLRLEAYTLDEIAEDTQRSQRTVRRLMERIKAMMRKRTAEFAMTAPSDRTPDSLGPAQQVFRPTTSNVAAGAVIAVLVVAGGIALSTYVVRQSFFPGFRPPQTAGERAGAIALTAIGLLVSSAGVAMALWIRMLAGFRLTLCKDGFHFVRRGRVQVYAWEDIERVEEVRLEQRLPLASGEASRLMPKTSSRNYTVHRVDGETFYFDGNVLPRASLLAGPLASAQQRHDFAWDVTEQEA